MTDTPEPQETRQEPCSGSQDCGRCSGEFCGIHGTSPCDCDTAERHADDIMPFSSPREPQKDETITALRNSGIDVTCGACMEVAYTGVTTNAHTCKLEPRQPHAALIAEIEQQLADYKLRYPHRYAMDHMDEGDSERMIGSHTLLRRCLLALKGQQLQGVPAERK